MIKFQRLLVLVSLVFLSACSEKKISCGFFDAPIRIAATAAATELDCNVDKVEESIKKGLLDLKVCKEKSAFAEINGKPALCMYVPMLATAIGDQATKTWECKKAGVKLSDLLVKALKCE